MKYILFFLPFLLTRCQGGDFSKANQSTHPKTGSISDSLFLLSNQNANIFEGEINSADGFCKKYTYQEVYLSEGGYEFFFFKYDIKCDTRLSDVIDERSNGGEYKRFDVFAFYYNIIDPDKMKDYHDVNIRFPTNLECKYWNGQNWIRQDLGLVSTYEELRTIQFRFMKKYL